MDFEDYSKFLFFVLWALYMLVRRGIQTARQMKARKQAAQGVEAPSELEGRADEEELAPEEEEEWWDPAILEEEFQLEPVADVPESELAPETEWGPPPAESVPVWEGEIPRRPRSRHVRRASHGGGEGFA